MEENKKRLFVDIDGTLAEFKNVDTLETLYEKGYFANLAPNTNVVEAVREINNNRPEIEVYILSSVLSDSQYALAEKQTWLEKYLPEIPPERCIFPPCGSDKKDFIPDGVRSDDFLLDDYSFNLNSWEPPARGIKLLNGINGNNGTWKSDSLSILNGGGDLSEKICRIMNNNEKIIEQRPQILQPQEEKNMKKYVLFSVETNSYVFNYKSAEITSAAELLNKYSKSGGVIPKLAEGCERLSDVSFAEYSQDSKNPPIFCAEINADNNSLQIYNNNYKSPEEELSESDIYAWYALDKALAAVSQGAVISDELKEAYDNFCYKNDIFNNEYIGFTAKNSDLPSELVTSEDVKKAAVYCTSQLESGELNADQVTWVRNLQDAIFKGDNTLALVSDDLKNICEKFVYHNDIFNDTSIDFAKQFGDFPAEITTAGDLEYIKEYCRKQLKSTALTAEQKENIIALRDALRDNEKAEKFIFGNKSEAVQNTREKFFNDDTPAFVAKNLRDTYDNFLYHNNIYNDTAIEFNKKYGDMPTEITTAGDLEYVKAYCAEQLEKGDLSPVERGSVLLLRDALAENEMTREFVAEAKQIGIWAAAAIEKAAERSQERGNNIPRDER